MSDDSRWWRHYETGEWVKCETCEERNAVGVASVPGIPYSAAFCVECIAAGAYPWWILVANQAAIGEGFEDTADWWQQVVRDTCHHLGRTLVEFKDAVLQVIQEEEEEMRERALTNDPPNGTPPDPEEFGHGYWEKGDYP